MRLLLGLMTAIAFAAVSQVGATPTRPGALLPRASPPPCSQRYVCPEPRPYPDTPDSGDDPGPDRFKCRIGWSVSDPNFAFCIYEKNTGNLVGSTPGGIQGLCWDKGMPNPECPTPARRRALPVRPRLAVTQQAAGSVVVGRFSKALKN
ncbi:hypothetical protein FA13DRAFT_1813006 [Coprinellus micaceus]|uniref:Uncharacterized protein n=1 Tax=Coprinellus micaceus TaxID=71717 RepID=A0A4Y7TH17_COPMI|nr:hypothetical protein FA13DRAFT_1813006 [Coprinellus micaceus]